MGRYIVGFMVVISSHGSADLYVTESQLCEHKNDNLPQSPDNSRASVSGRMDVIYVRILLPYAEKFDPGRMTYVQSLSVTSA